MDTENRKLKKQNMRIYPIYKTIGVDFIFFYSIRFLFLTQVKGISASNILLSISFYAIFMIILQMPISMVVNRLGTKKSTVLANIISVLYIILIMMSTNLLTLIIAEFVSALCFSIKDVSDPTLLRDSVPDGEAKSSIFSKLEGKGCKNYFYFDAITAVSAGFLYVINAYIPMILSMLFAIFATIISLSFNEIKVEKEKKKQNPVKELKEQIRKLKKSMTFIIKSQRLRSLLIYAGITRGIYSLIATYGDSLLVDIGVSAQIIAIVGAIYSIATGIGSEKQEKFHNRYKNKSLSIMLILTLIPIIIIGIVGKLGLSFNTSLIIIVILMTFIVAIKGINMILVKKYLANFTQNDIIVQILATDAIIRNLFRAIIGFFGAYLLKITDTANAFIIIGVLLLVASLGLISYMKTRLGLKPQEYDKSEFYKN